MTLIRQIYEQIRMKILNGVLQEGERLPSSRQLASELKVSRSVVIEAYEQLLSEGYIGGKQGAGTYVLKGAFLGKDLTKEMTLSLNGQENKDRTSDYIDFRSGVPALDLFPRKQWGELSKKTCFEASHSIFGYHSPEGQLELRNVLSRYLRRVRGVHCHPEQLVITSGATQAMSIIAHLLLDSGDEVIIEDPITYEIQKIFTSRKASLYPIPVDEQGMQTDLLPEDRKPRFVFVTPSHQFPLGSILPIQRRVQLINYARKVDCFIVEDDYDSEFSYLNSPISSLQGLDPSKVIYIGTFSKILSPGLRIGYLILPPVLVNRCKDLKWFTDLHNSSLEQLTLTTFMEDGLLERHIRKMKKLYHHRLLTLKNALIESFETDVKISGDSTGLHLIAEFKGISFDEPFIQRIQEEYKVKIYSVEQHAIQKGKHVNKVIIGYGNLEPKEIEEGVRRLKMALTHFTILPQ